jgi:mRNA interferase HigB
MDDVRRTVPKAKVLNRDRVRFEIAGGNYRLIASFDFRRQIVFIKLSERMPSTTLSMP